MSDDMKVSWQWQRQQHLWIDPEIAKPEDGQVIIAVLRDKGSVEGEYRNGFIHEQRYTDAERYYLVDVLMWAPTPRPRDQEDEKSQNMENE